MAVLTVESCLRQPVMWSFMLVFTLVWNHTRVNTVHKDSEDLTTWRHICWGHTMKERGSHVTFVRRNSALRVTLSNTFSDMKVWSRMFAMNVQSVSVQQVNWNIISHMSQFTLTTNSSVVSYATDSSNVFAMLSSTSRSVLLYTVSASFCCDYEQFVWETTDDISWQINSVDKLCLQQRIRSVLCYECRSVSDEFVVDETYRSVVTDTSLSAATYFDRFICVHLAD